MIFISVTRLRVRSIFFLAQFIWQALKTGRQAEQASGFLGGRLAREAGNIFWTVTMWTDEAAMRAYRSADAHAKVMPKLANWCNEASVVHWSQEKAEVPDWQVAHRRMVEQGRPSKVNQPSPNQTAKQIAAPRLGGNDGRILKPAPAQK